MAGTRALEDALRRAAARFVEQVIGIVEANVQPSGAAPRTGPGLPRIRRRAASLERLAAAIVQVLARRSGLAVSDIAGAIGATPREISRPITWLLARGKVSKVGERKGTRYSLARRVEAEVAPPEARDEEADAGEGAGAAGAKAGDRSTESAPEASAEHETDEETKVNPRSGGPDLPQAPAIR